MVEYIPIICLTISIFLGGFASGAGVMIIGLKYGFKVSYEIRSHQEESAEGKGLFPSKKDPGEFELLEDEKPKEIEQ